MVSQWWVVSLFIFIVWLISSFSVLCLGSSCCAEGGWQHRYLQPLWLHLENITSSTPRCRMPVNVYFLFLHKIPQRCKGYNGFVTLQPCCQWVSCSDSKNMWTCQWYVFPHEGGLGINMTCRKSTFVRLVCQSSRVCAGRNGVPGGLNIFINFGIK